METSSRGVITDASISPILNYDRSLYYSQYSQSAEEKAKHSEYMIKAWDKKLANEKPKAERAVVSAKDKINYLSRYSETLSTAMKVNREFKFQFSDMVQKSKNLKTVTYKLSLNQPVCDEDKDVINKFFDECKDKKEMKIYSWTLDQMRKELLTGLGFELEGNTDED